MDAEKPLTPPSPPLSGGERCAQPLEASTPAPDKGKVAPATFAIGRVGEGFNAAAKHPKFIAYNKRLTELARQNRKNPTPAEHLLWQKVLRSKQFSQYKFQRQKPLGSFIVDFYCAELRLVIEIDGDSHAGQVAYDADRTAILDRRGLRVLRYTNDDIRSNLSGVFDDLSTFIPSEQP